MFKVTIIKERLAYKFKNEDIKVKLVYKNADLKEYSILLNGKHVSYLHLEKIQGWSIDHEEMVSLEEIIENDLNQKEVKRMVEIDNYVESLNEEETVKLLDQLHQGTTSYNKVLAHLNNLKQETTQEERVMENTKNKIKLLYGLAEKTEKMSMEELQNTEFAKTIEDITGRNVYDKFEELELDQIFNIEDSFIEECIVQKTEKYGALSVHYFLSQIDGNTEYVEFDGYENLRPVYLSDKIKDVLAIINPIIGSLEDYLWDLEYNQA